MKLAAAVIVRNELNRYLRECVASLLEFCDEVRILDDASTDGWIEECRGVWGEDGRRVIAMTGATETRNEEPAFHRHAVARNRLLEWALEGWPTHVLSIDADEFVDDGSLVRKACDQASYGAWSLCMEEIWNAAEGGLDVRQDGGWAEHDVTMLWRAEGLRGALRLSDRGHATGRVPDAVHDLSRGHTCAAALHFGWTNRPERDERYARYAEGDAGQFHARAHIDSIMLPDDRIALTSRPWPPTWTQERKTAVLRHAAAT